eukprot:CAMPEP_0204279574 /NCGR_PEP_ID=MMETSP0468-20130131/35545_1 /ASSEMBLY_ACC=CAM_ASM_000383 /TAXON_ID=2969 /ORGANISM="Oxyrrhis marina" /LENGTH=238 /DNA_ID=CAMNT_0051256689 /DNA_START=317 /DNA_END=1034 /DNA_ORIENTATION=-
MGNIAQGDHLGEPADGMASVNCARILQIGSHLRSGRKSHLRHLLAIRALKSDAVDHRHTSGSIHRRLELDERISCADPAARAAGQAHGVACACDPACVEKGAKAVVVMRLGILRSIKVVGPVTGLSSPGGGGAGQLEENNPGVASPMLPLSLPEAVVKLVSLFASGDPDRLAAPDSIPPAVRGAPAEPQAPHTAVPTVSVYAGHTRVTFMLLLELNVSPSIFAEWASASVCDSNLTKA